MAQGIEFPQQNDWLGKPENTSNHQVYALPICRFMTCIPGVIPRAPAQRVPAYIACWELTDDEVEEIIRTRRVYTKIIGYTQPPMSIHGKLPLYPGDGSLSDIILDKDQIDQLHGRK